MPDSILFKSAFAIPAGGAGMPTDSLCPGDLPLVLFPVRLETRFFKVSDAVTELRVRVYPDKIHLDSHERALTTDERTWGEHYWQQDWLAGDDMTARTNAWRQIADRFGAARAAWIARVLTPTNPLQRPGESPIFPDVETTPAGEDDAWRHAPQARLLPDRWIAVLHSGGSVVSSVPSNPIRRPLAVGPDPKAEALDNEAEAAIRAGERLAIDDGMKWMVDFIAAEEAGMALRIQVTPATLAAGIDSLLVFGVAKSLSAEETSQQLADLFDAHHYTDGLAFLRPGTPTNNTEDRRADYNAADPGHQKSFATEIAANAILDDNSNALRVGTALGLPASRIPDTLGRIARQAAQEDADARAMNLALWSVGWGYFLSNMVGAETGLTTDDIDWAQDRFAAHVRAFGPYPTLRCGPQPYGILPVTSLSQWQAGQDDTSRDTWLKDFLLTLRDQIWRPALPAAIRIGSRANKPDADLADVMRMDAVSNGYRVRNVFGRHFLKHLEFFVTHDWLGWPDQDRSQTSLLERLAIAWRPRLTHTWNAGWAWKISAPLVQAGEVSPWAMLEPNYIQTLAGLSIEEAINWRPAPDVTDNTTSLLQTLLRHAFLREVAQIPALLQGRGLAWIRDSELIDLVSGAEPTLHWKRQLQLKAGADTGDKTIQQCIDDSMVLRSLGSFRSSLARLQTLDSEALQLLMQGTLDLSAHRLDAWITSFATKRLESMRRGSPTGQYVGAYGWVENLKPIPAERARTVTSLPTGEPSPLQTPANDSGFIHAPSITHAATAALLRNAHLRPEGQPGPNDPFAINLSSRRVRTAAKLLEGVRQGQPLGALLGYRVERFLHETRFDGDRTLDRYIAPLRRLAPLAARENSTVPLEMIAANNVVDGLVLHRLIKQDSEAVRSAVAMDTSPFNALAALLDDMIDGLGDALTAEAGYQMARGNISRMASTVAAISQGDAPPPELEVTRTPRTGTALTHRVLLLMSGASNMNTPGWVARDARARSNAEPFLNYWAGKILGDASKIRCTIERLDANGNVAETRALHLSELGLSVLDGVYSVDPATAGSASETSLTEIEQQLLYVSKHRSGGFDPLATLRIQHARPMDLAAGEITLLDMIEQARALRRLLASARGASPEDLNPAERTSRGTIDLAELEVRVVRAENQINAAHVALRTVAARKTATAEALRAAIFKLAEFGVESAIPVNAAGEDIDSIAALVRQAQALLKMSGARVDQFEALRQIAAATDPRARTEQLIARLRAVFGPSYVVLPRFTFESDAATELASALAGGLEQGGTALATNTWFARYSRVRDALGRLGACLQGAEVLGTGTRLDLRVAQLPFSSSEQWVGLPPQANTELPPSKLSLVLHTVRAINTTEVMTGVLVDEWTEVVPNTQETTALAFQFDVPDSMAPQCVLVAVPPVPGQEWTPERLRRVLMETLDLAKLRAVDPSLLGQAAQHLPGLYLAFNAADDAVSTDFKPLTA